MSTTPDPKSSIWRDLKNVWDNRPTAQSMKDAKAAQRAAASSRPTGGALKKKPAAKKTKAPKKKPAAKKPKARK